MGRLPTGVRKVGKRYEKRFTVNKIRYSVYAYSVDDLPQAEALKREEIKKGIYTTSENLTLNELYQRWEMSRIDSVKPNTIRVSRQRYKRLAECAIDKTGKTLGTLKLKEIEPQQIRKAMQDMKSSYGIDSINQSYSSIKQMLELAKKERSIEWNPCEVVQRLKHDRKSKNASETIHRALTREETKKFLESAENSYYKNLFLFMLNTGLRVGEAVTIKYTDIDEINRTISINRTLTHDIDGALVIGDTTKTKDSKRKIPITQAVHKIIREQQDINRALHFKNINKLLFYSQTGNIVNHTSVNQEIAKICKRADIERFSSHALRDTFATRAIESGMNPKTLQMILGHSDFSITMNLYCHVMEDTKQEEMKLLRII